VRQSTLPLRSASLLRPPPPLPVATAPLACEKGKKKSRSSQSHNPADPHPWRPQRHHITPPPHAATLRTHDHPTHRQSSPAQVPRPPSRQWSSRSIPTVETTRCPDGRGHTMFLASPDPSSAPSRTRASADATFSPDDSRDEEPYAAGWSRAPTWRTAGASVSSSPRIPLFPLP